MLQTVLTWVFIAISFLSQQLALLDELEILAINPKLKKVCLIVAHIFGVALNILSALGEQS